jgi:hypothetical protein
MEEKNKMNKIEKLAGDLTIYLENLPYDILDSEMVASLELVKFALMSQAWDNSEDIKKEYGFNGIVDGKWRTSEDIKKEYGFNK